MPVQDRGTTSEERALERKMDTAAWGVFLLWIGIALLADVGWGVGLVGAGAITLAAQAWRKRLGLRADRFSVLLGIVSGVVGIWNIFEVRLELVPLLFIAAGGALLVSTWRRPRAGGGSPSLDAQAHPRS
jgi:hypothetical protein